MATTWRLQKALLVIAPLATSTVHAATVSQVYGDTLTKQAQTFYVRGDAGWTTYQSQAAASNATATVGTITIGGCAGESRTLGISMTMANSTVPFALDNSKSHTAFDDLRIDYRLAWFYPTFVASLSQVSISHQGQQLTDLYGTGYGGGLGFKVPLNSTMIVYGSALGIKTPTATDKVAQPVALGLRKEGDLGASFRVVPDFADLLVGYRYRGFGVTVNGTSYTESQAGAYVGASLGVYF